MSKRMQAAVEPNNLKEILAYIKKNWRGKYEQLPDDQEQIDSQQKNGAKGFMNNSRCE